MDGEGRSPACFSQSALACVCHLYLNAVNAPPPVDTADAGTSWRVTRRLLHPVDASYYGSASRDAVGHVWLMYGDWTRLFRRRLLSSSSSSSVRLFFFSLVASVEARPGCSLVGNFLHVSIRALRFRSDRPQKSCAYNSWNYMRHPVGVLHLRWSVTPEVDVVASVETSVIDSVIYRLYLILPSQAFPSPQPYPSRREFTLSRKTVAFILPGNLLVTLSATRRLVRQRLLRAAESPTDTWTYYKLLFD